MRLLAALLFPAFAAGANLRFGANCTASGIMPLVVGAPACHCGAAATNTCASTATAPKWCLLDGTCSNKNRADHDDAAAAAAGTTNCPRDSWSKIVTACKCGTTLSCAANKVKRETHSTRVPVLYFDHTVRHKAFSIVLQKCDISAFVRLV